ncbi:MAG: hypothetical protein R3B99_36995, partial [Polyangiales bacterium]
MPGTPMPLVGVVTSCGSTGLDDSAPDVFWRSDAPAADQAFANETITVAQARSTAVLTIPPGASVTHAFLYWGARATTPDGTVTLDRPGVFTQDLTAIQSFVGANQSYQSVADVTELVQAQGAGAYRVSGVDSVVLANANDNNAYAGWWMVVLYELATDPLRSLTIYDGLDTVTNGAPQNVTLGGFRVPAVFGA